MSISQLLWLPALAFLGSWPHPSSFCLHLHMPSSYAFISFMPILFFSFEYYLYWMGGLPDGLMFTLLPRKVSLPKHIVPPTVKPHSSLPFRLTAGFVLVDSCVWVCRTTSILFSLPWFHPTPVTATFWPRYQPLISGMLHSPIWVFSYL